MSRLAWLVLFAVSYAPAATVYTQVNCNGSITNGTSSAQCRTDFAIAGAEVSAQPAYQNSVDFDTSQYADAAYIAYASASASFADSYIFRVTSGGMGAGFAIPCFLATWDVLDGYGGASISFGGSSWGTGGSPAFGSSSNCGINVVQPQPIPFTFGVPQIVVVSMNGLWETIPFRNSSGGVSVSMYGFEFFDAYGNPLTNVDFTLHSTTVPEPGTLSLLLAGIVSLLPADFRRHR